MIETDDRSETLVPYVPRLLLAWEADGSAGRCRELEGTLVFVDISGFTKLSERLAKLGKRGAEEVAAAIGGCFEALLAVAYEAGGGLIKFGGDALLLFFDGPDHAFRGAVAAAGMRRTLRRVGDLRTAGGRVTLKMSVGVHTGTFAFFRVGESHRELIVTGPAASQTVTMESNAEAGDVLVSTATADLLPARMLGGRKGPGILLREPTTAMPPGPVPSFPVSVNVERCVPKAIRQHLLDGGDLPEHRLVCIAFIHFDGVDELVEREGVEAVAEHLDGLVRCAQEACEAHDVTFLATDVDHDGGKVILVTGAPKATEDDEVRMLLALRQITDTNDGLPIRIGANRGYAFAGDIGPSYRRTYTIMGDPVNLAARVMAAAEPGQILVTESMLLSSRARFDTVALPPFFVKGKANAVQAFALGAATGGTTAGPVRRLLPLVGRDADMDVLRSALEKARARRGCLVQLVGDPGIGKSRLVEETRMRASDMTILATTSEFYSAMTPYASFRSLFRALLGLPVDVEPEVVVARLEDRARHNAPHLLPWLPLLGIPLDLDIPMTPETEALDAAFVRSRLHEVVAGFLSWTLPTPTLLVFEDVHNMDEASGELLAHLGGEVGHEPWMILITRRDVTTGFVPTEGSEVTTIRLTPLEAADAVSLVHAATEDERPFSQHDARTLADRAGGNPLFLETLVSEAQSAGSTDALPESIDAVITARIDRLPPRERTLLRHAAVLGSIFTVELLSAVSGDTVPGAGHPTWSHLTEFLVEETLGRFRFPHALIRDAAYEGLPFRTRQELHGRAGEAILASASDPAEVSEALSLHFFHAQRFDGAWTYSRMAGARAAAKYSNVEAASFFERALASAARLGDVPAEELGTVSESLGDAWTRAGEFRRAEVALRNARRQASGDPVREARLLLKQAWIPHRVGRFSEAMRWISRGLRLLEGVDEPEARRQRAELCVWYAVMRRSQGRPRDAIRWCQLAIEEALASDAREALALAYSTQDSAYHSLGRSDVPLRSHDALEIYESLGDLGGQAVVLNNLGVWAYWDGRWDEAMSLYDRGREARERTGDPVNAAFGTINVAEILSDQGRLDEAERLAREALRVWKAAGDRDGVAFATSLLGRLASRALRFDEADRRFAAARVEFEDVGSLADVLETDARIAESLVFRGEPERALEVLEATMARARGADGLGFLHEPLMRRTRGTAYLQVERLDEAEVEFEASLSAAREHGADYEVALTLHAMAELSSARGELAVDALAEAEEILDRLGVVAIPGVVQESDLAVVVDDVTTIAST